MLNIITFALAASAGVVPAKPQPSYTLAQAIVVDSVVVTSDLYTKYITVKKALFDFWKTAEKSDTALFNKAKATAVVHTVNFGGLKGKAGVYDYPTFIKQNTTLAGIFTNNHVTFEEFVPLHLAILQAVGTMAVAEAKGSALPATTTALGKNIEFLKPHRQELTDVGVAVTVSKGGGGGGGGMGRGGNDDLNP